MKITLNKSFLEKGFVILAFLLFTDGLLAILRPQGVLDVSQGDPITQLVLFVVYVVALFLIVPRWKQVVWAITREKLLLILVAIALTSVIWSGAPMLTARRSAALLGTTLFGVYFGTRYSLSEQLRLLAWALGTAAVLSLVVALVLPSYGVHVGDAHAGAWKGIYSHKNGLGRPMALGVVVFALFAFWGERYRWVGWAGFGLLIFLILKSTSGTPLLSSLTFLAILPIYSIWRWRYPLKLPFFIMALMVGGSIFIGVWINLETVLGAVGKDITFTGRSELWFYLIEMIQKRLWLGYGYGGFWRGWEGDSYYVWTAISWHPKYAHNGYLQLGIDLGLLGLSVFIIGFLMNFIRAFNISYATKTPEHLFPLAYFTFMLPYNISDSIILQQNSLFWVLYVSTSLSMVIQQNELFKVSALAKTSINGNISNAQNKKVVMFLGKSANK